MKSKYYLAIKFFNDTKNYDQLDILYKEIELFLDNYSQYKFFIELDLINLDPKLEARLENEHNDIKEMLNDELYLDFVNDYRFRACENIFSNYNYNFELFKYALEKVFEDERNEEQERLNKEKEEAKNNVNSNTNTNRSVWMNYKNKDYFYIFSIILFIVTFISVGYLSMKVIK